MSQVYMTSDWHIGHKTISKYRPRFPTPADNDAHFVSMFNQTVTKRDTAIFLGDIAFTSEAIQFLHNELAPCKKILYMGNHDTVPVEEYLTVFDEVWGLRSYKGFWLSHCPIHPQEMRSRTGCIHGHLHNIVLDDTRYFDVSPEKHNYNMVPFEDIKNYFKENNGLHTFN